MVGRKMAYVKPLLADGLAACTYKLLLLNADFFALLDGDRCHVHYEELPTDVKHYFAETFPEFDGDTSPLDYYSLTDHASPYHDHKSRAAVTAEEAEKFFRYVNKAMTDTLVKDDPTPVILVCAPEHEHAFKQICTFDTLLPEVIAKDPRTLRGDVLVADAVAIMDARKASALDVARDDFEAKLAHGHATDDINAVGLALVERKVATLFVVADKAVPGSFDRETGRVTYDATQDPIPPAELDPKSADVTNCMARRALAQDAVVYVLAEDAMPAASPICAIYRY
jgi:hypothetical protein